MDLLILKLKEKMAELNEFGRQFLPVLQHAQQFWCLLFQLRFSTFNLCATSE